MQEQSKPRSSAVCENQHKLSASVPSLDAYLNKLEKLHSSPGVAWRILQLVRHDDFDVADVASLLESDPALTASILRLVNSSAFGLAHKVTNLRHAITFLGAKSLRLAVLSFNIVTRLTKGVPAQVCDDFWRRALTQAAAASQLCRQHRSAGADEAYCAGLLADIGVLAFCQADTQNYPRLYQSTRHGQDLVLTEKSHYGFDHAILGQRLMEKWGLPQCLARLIGRHHDLADSREPLPRAVFAGVLLSEVLWTPASDQVSQARQWLAEHYRMDTDRFIEFAVQCKQAVLDNAEWFSVSLKGEIDIVALQRECRREFRRRALEAALEYDSLSAVLDQRYTV